MNSAQQLVHGTPAPSLAVASFIVAGEVVERHLGLLPAAVERVALGGGLLAPVGELLKGVDRAREGDVVDVSWLGLGLGLGLGRGRGLGLGPGPGLG
jgi:hypothetical protein